MPQNKTVDMSNTMHAEIGTSDRYLCPEGHDLQEIDGTIASLGSNQCAGPCGSANEVNDMNWFRCKACFYKICFDCTHCDVGLHNLVVVQADLPVECHSCGEDDLPKHWQCELVQSGECDDAKVICLNCMPAKEIQPQLE